MGLTSEILQKVDAVTLSYTAKSYQEIVAQHSIELHLMLILYIALYGLAVLQGATRGTFRDMGKHILKAFLIFELATNWGIFTIFFYDVFTVGPDKLIGALTNGIKPSEQLSGIFDTGMICAVRLINKAGTFDFGIMATGLLVMFGTMLMVGVALFLIVLSKLGLAILLTLAPLFIALALWRGTQGLFQSWINYLFNFALIPVITYGLLAMLILIMEEAVNKIELAGETITMKDVIPYLLIGSIAGLIFSEVNRIASSLGSGMALSTVGAFSRHVTRPTQQVVSKLSKAVSAKSNSRSQDKAPTKSTPPSSNSSNAQSSTANRSTAYRSSSLSNDAWKSAGTNDRTSQYSSLRNFRSKKK